MAKIPNNENVKTIIMYPIAYTKCRIGQDWFLNRFEVHFTPNDCYPDYMEVNAFIQENIEGKELNIEEAAKTLYDYLKCEYKPNELQVTNHIRDCNTHFNVDVVVG